MKKIIALLLTISLLISGCSNADSLLNKGMENYAAGKPVSDKVPDTVLDKLDNMFAKYTGGFKVIDVKNAVIEIDDKDVLDPTQSETAGQTQDQTSQTTSGTNPSINPDPTTSEPKIVTSTANSMEEVYEILLNTISNTDEQVEFNTNGFQLTGDDIAKLFFEDLRTNEMVEYMCVSSTEFYQNINTVTNQNTVHIQINYSLPIDKIMQMKDETYKKAEKIVSTYDLLSKSPYDQVDTINTLLCDLVVYPPNTPYTEESFTAYGALIEGSAVCDGYARAAQLLMSMCGIESLYVVGTANNGVGHAWNMVKLNGQWYQLDVTWDDGSYSRSDYFLVTDDYMRQSRTWDEDKYPETAEEGYAAA